ncbi:putative O-methyltransferase YrrM [Nocardia caishijiensis]|uniref:O-methyltransferase YrrM n=2 Tax=Nocardia caishijiensis TaxID=184756 RepID=A0ABQ6YUD8_9NOCA|nr:putative O-methyltransferase YrrM [Nocardia caishijiensis]
MQVSPEEGQFINLIARAVNCRRALEIGVYTGYSLLSIALAVPADGLVIGCEVDPEFAAVARTYCERAGLSDRVDIRIDDARATLASLLTDEQAAGTFDLAFIDADKPGYIDYYEAVLELLRPGGLLLVDNVLWSGKVADEGGTADADTVALRDFNRHIGADDRVWLSMLPFADGITFAVKR